MKQFRISSILSASAFCPFCPHPHFILFVRIRILSFLSASAFYPFSPHSYFIIFVRIRILFCPSVRQRVHPSVRIRVLSQTVSKLIFFGFLIGQKRITCRSTKRRVYCIALATRQPVHNRIFIDRSKIEWVQCAWASTVKFQSSFY
jgi:hypothetical protein